MIRYHEHTQEETDVEQLTDLEGGYCIMLYNDDHNTFDHVIECLIKYCDHSLEQAEQCSLIVHYKGKCVVKYGDSTELKAICDALCRQDLSAVIEKA